MKISLNQIDTLIDTGNGMLNSLVIENKEFFYKTAYELFMQCEGFDGNNSLFLKDKRLIFSKDAEVIANFLPFEINRKTLLSKIQSSLENKSTEPNLYEDGNRILSNIEKYLYDLTFDYSCDFTFNKISIQNLIKMSGLEIRDEYENLTEKVLDYMELVREFDRNKLFILINFRSYITEKEALLFSESIINHNYDILLIDSISYQCLNNEKRVTIDMDLCEI